MSRYTITPSAPVTHEELERWRREKSYFDFQPPNPHAPENSPEHKGWGLPPQYWPPKDAVEFVTFMFKRDVAQRPQGEQLRPEFKWSIVVTCVAYFLWLRTKPGYDWLMRFYGVEEIPPFWDGYAYIYVDPKTNTPVHITREASISLRIFRACERAVDAPISSAYDELADEMQGLVNEARNPRAAEPVPEPPGDMYYWVANQLRTWFHNPAYIPDPQTGHQVTLNRKGKLSGYQWAKTFERRKGVLFYEALDKVETLAVRAYRLKDPRGGLMWSGIRSMKLVPLVDVYRHQRTMAEHELDNTFRCSSCQKMRSCLPLTNEYKLCCACFGRQMETDDRPTLKWCTYRECAVPKETGCPMYIDSESDLIALKNRLNRGPQFPVERPR